MMLISNNPPLVEGVRYSTNVESTRREFNSPRQNDISYEKFISKETQNTIVSEKPGSYANAANFYRYQYSSPASRMFNTGQIFNEVEKPFVNKNFSARNKNNNPQSENFKLGYENYDTVVGYYFVDAKYNKESKKDSSSKQFHPMKSRLDKTYHTGTGSQTGALVNVMYY